MFAYSGSASFPTYQADMQNKSDFPKAVLLAMISKYGPGAVAHTELMYSSLQFWCSSTCPWQLLDISNWDSWQTMMEVFKTHKIKYLKTMKVILLPGIACVLCDSNIKLVVEVLLLIHLISAYPMFLNPPNQFFEAMMGIPPTFNWKRILFRTSVMVILLFLAESLPSFSAILQLIVSIYYIFTTYFNQKYYTFTTFM